MKRLKKSQYVHYDRSSVYKRGDIPVRFMVKTKFEDDPDSFQCEVDEIHPYDDADYAWAKKDSPTSASIIQNGKCVQLIPLPEWDADYYEDPSEYFDEIIDTIAVELRKYNEPIEPIMVHN